MYKTYRDVPEYYSLEMLGYYASLLSSNVDIEYVVLHKKSGCSYCNIYPTKFKAYFEAIKPRYWSYETVVFARPKYSVTSEPKPEVDYSSYT